MKRADFINGVVFKPKHTGGKRVYEVRHGDIISYIPGMRKLTLLTEGTIRPTNSNKGFTVVTTIMGNEAGVFLPFADFEIVDP